MAISMGKNKKGFLPIIPAFAFAVFFLVNSLFAQGTLVINEIMGSNSRIFDEDGDAPDWVEIYNPTGRAIDLEGYGLSDKPGNLKRWVFPERAIGPGEHLVVFASGKDRGGKPATYTRISGYPKKMKGFTFQTEMERSLIK